MKTYGLIGFPLSSSFSEKYFQEKFRKEKISGAEYKLFPLRNIKEFPKILKNNVSLCGINVTIPHKETVIPFLDELDGEAGKIGAVNTIKISRQSEAGSCQTPPLKRGGRVYPVGRNDRIGGVCHLKGFNTDVYGFSESLKPLLRGHHKKALVLGTGGGAKAVGYVLRQLGIEYLFVSRNPVTPVIARPRFSRGRSNLYSGNQISYHDLNENLLNTHHLIINATPLGMYPGTETYPDMPYRYLTRRHLLYDLVYPGGTPFLKSGRKRGAAVKNGLEMLELQAEKSWEIWNAL